MDAPLVGATGDDVVSRADELAAALGALRDRVARACAASGRDASEVTTVVVTKTYPASDLELLASFGVTEVGEARDVEGREKRSRLEGLGLRWHCIGQVQTKKAGSVARWADVVHSADREKLVRSLSRGAVAEGRTLDVLVQVDLDPSGGPRSGSGRGGAPSAEVPALAEAVAGSEGLRLAGVMAVAPLGADPERAFTRLHEVAERVRADHPAARWISAGMSADLETAVACGATHLRVGSAVLGSRPPLG